MFPGAVQQLSSGCLCGPGAVKWIEVWFGDCVYTQLELLGFVVGMSSVFFWMVAQVPQFCTNILRQSAEALSPWFLFQWLAGDSLNLLGCLLTGDQLATETFTAYYFMFSDCLILSQFFYYQARNKDRDYYLDESMHKPAFGYETVLSIQCGPPLSEQAADCSSTSAPSTSKSSSVMSPQPFGVMARGERFLDYEEAKLKYSNHHQIASPKPRKSNANDSRRQLRRIVMEYGLEYGPACVSRLTTQHAVRLSQIQLKNSSSSGKPTTRLKKALCLAGLTTVVVGLFNAGPEMVTGDHLGVGSSSWTNRKLLMLCTSGSSRTLWAKHIGSVFGWVSAALYLGSRVSQLLKNQQRKSAEGLSLGMVTCAVLANLCYGSAILLRLESWADLMGKAPWLLGSMGTVSLDIAIFLQAQYLSLRCEKEPTERTPLLS